MKDLCYPFEEKCAVTLGFDEMYGSIRHAGYDFSTSDLRKRGKINIYAPFDGLVTRSVRTSAGFYTCIYSQSENVTMEFWHISGDKVVNEGQQVKKGDTIGHLGISGPYAEHTHVQFNKGNYVQGTWNANVTNPQPYFDRMDLRSNLMQEDSMLIEELKSQIDALKQQINDLEATVFSQKDILSQQEKELVILNDSKASYDKTIAEKQSELDTAIRATNDAVNQLNEIKAQDEEKDKTIQHQKEMIAILQSQQEDVKTLLYKLLGKVLSWLSQKLPKKR